jgi:hypothetical protein
VTGIFDFVRDITSQASEFGIEQLVKDVLYAVITQNTNKHTMAFIREHFSGEDMVAYSIKDWQDFFSDFHDLDHHHNHNIWSRISINILVEFEEFFRYSDNYPDLERADIVFSNALITLFKYVPSARKYMQSNYRHESGYIWNLKDIQDKR